MTGKKLAGLVKKLKITIIHKAQRTLYGQVKMYSCSEYVVSVRIISLFTESSNLVVLEPTC